MQKMTHRGILAMIAASAPSEKCSGLLQVHARNNGTWKNLCTKQYRCEKNFHLLAGPHPDFKVWGVKYILRVARLLFCIFKTSISGNNTVWWCTAPVATTLLACTHQLQCYVCENFHWRCICTLENDHRFNSKQLFLISFE